ncbi:carotenoid oxygenase family protein [Streptomyces sp. DH7]|uniref:carotenoid oxygenase family protein n=1 Tax=Streptomyces sp. DH7 TaxID=2857006 RepID=UPI001E469A5F|nr:carotenoid oxygenase family protein [Streptomyces sp. DH7]
MDLRHGGWAQEVDAELRPRQRAVPQGLAGTLYRNGAGNHLSDHVIDGDGLVSAVTFTPGSPVHVRSRYVRPPSYRASLKAPGADAPPVRLAGADAAGGRLRNLLLRRPAASQAGTSVAMIDGRLLALREGDMPWELEPGTLATLGRCDLDRAPAPSGLLGRRLCSPYSAHPCRGPRTAETGNFGRVYGPRPRPNIYRTAQGGPTEKRRSIALPHRYVVHDFAMTATHLVFCLGPVILDLPAVASGRVPAFQAMRWHGEEATRILTVPRAGGPFRVVEADPWFQWHFAGAYDDGDDFVFDLARFRSWTVMHEAISSMGHLTDPSCFPVGRLWRYRVTASGKVEDHQLNALPMEWPTIDPRRSTTAHRNVYGATIGAPASGVAFTAVARHDTELGEADVHDYGPGHLVSEPLFVPRDRKRLDEQGWLVAYEAQPTAGTANIVVFDAQSVTGGPLCTLPVPESPGFTFHGQWVHA